MHTDRKGHGMYLKIKDNFNKITIIDCLKYTAVTDGSWDMSEQLYRGLSSVCISL